LYVFDYRATRADIEKSLGTDFPTYVEFTRRIVFLKSGNIVRREDEPTDIERAVNGEVAFTEANTDGSSNLHGPYTPETSVFLAEKKYFACCLCYVLMQLK
jgi:hypothetical protein